MYTYGPVPSRRLGRSLGVSVIPHKVCTHSCVYCQLGRTHSPRVQPASFFDRDSVMSELAQRMRTATLDCITFVGDGEPTLSIDLGWYIAQCKSRWTVPVAVITNGALLSRESIRHDLTRADIVLPSLDAGDAETFKAVNRPHPDICFETYVRGLVAFRQEFAGQVRLEVMLVKGVNDNENSLRRIRKLAWAIRPDRVDVAIPTRPPAEPWVVPPDVEQILRAQRLLRSAESMTRPEDGEFDIAGFTSVLEAILGLSSRHPLRWSQAEQVALSLGQPHELDYLVNAGALCVREYGGERYVAPAARRHART